MFEKLEDVPLAIKEFYHELVTEDGNTVVGELLRNDLKSWDFVELVMSRKGKFEFIKHCINKAIEAEKWQFHDEYISWLKDSPDPEAEKYALVDKEGVPLHSYDDDFALWESLEPVMVVTDGNAKLREYNANTAISTRYEAVYAILPITLVSAIESTIDVGQGKDGVYGIDNIKDAVTAYNVGMTSTGTVLWIMADNSVQELTLVDLNQVIIDFNERKQNVFNAYSTWRNGDTLTPFVV